MEAELVSELAGLRRSIDRAAAEAEITLRASLDDDQGSLVLERTELCRQLAALRERVTTAEHRSEDRTALRAELATLLCFARTLLADADAWLSKRDATIEERERQRTAAREEQESLAAEREIIAQRRDDLQQSIVQTAARMVQREGGEWRRTLPVLTVDDDLTVCSASVSCPRKGLRVPRFWLVTLNRSRDDVLVRPG